ncbi:MAG: 2-C-methyl-D-erythritol 4-phosphate cytidylyltransferase [Treponema sp.]|jgi:2-C-methyl-D-erythritol 4-phosphate cytidylyltransferase|nr:2-C-methyl-D-erythritol 4-phosphate cytidylyltransferase [Treponema sp.]
MNIALVIAGGTGRRTLQEIPKQFINVYDKPILIYTLEGFQTHPDIEAIEVVCLEGWHEIVKAYAKQYAISKLAWIVNGGETGQESIRNGIYTLAEQCNADDIVIIHDGIRPLIDKAVVSDCIAICKKYGNAVSSLPYNEQIFKTADGLTTTEYIPRETVRRVQTPQAYILDNVYKSYKKAFDKKIGIYGSSYTNTMMAELGETLHFAAGSDRNIKITTLDDIELFKALLSIEKRNG